MAVTRLKRKALRRKVDSQRRKTVLKHLTAKPVLKKREEGEKVEEKVEG